MVIVVASVGVFFLLRFVSFCYTYIRIIVITFSNIFGRYIRGIYVFQIPIPFDNGWCIAYLLC